MENTKRKRGFTLVELITVIAMLILLMGAVTSAVSGARRRAKIQQAISEVQELTNAILAFENFIDPRKKDSPLRGKVTGDDWVEASKEKMKFVLGEEKNPNGQDGNVPVLFNGAVRGEKILDPWGNAYRFRIKAPDMDADDQAGNASGSAVAIPNINRIPADEVN